MYRLDVRGIFRTQFVRYIIPLDEWMYIACMKSTLLAMVIHYISELMTPYLLIHFIVRYYRYTIETYTYMGHI